MGRPKIFWQQGWPWWVIIIIISAAAVSPIRQLWQKSLGTIGQALVSIKPNFSWPPSGSIRRLETDRDQLRDQIAVLTVRLAEAQQQIETAAELKDLTSYVKNIHGRTAIANVIAYSPDPGVDSLIISRGSVDGIVAGQAVVAANGLLVGKVARVNTQTSAVLLLSDGRSKVAGRIQNSHRSPGIIIGERGLAMTMDFIPKNDEVKSGQTVVTAGTEPLIPPDVVIGTIRETSSRHGELFRRATVVSPVQFKRILAVAVLLVQP